MNRSDLQIRAAAGAPLSRPRRRLPQHCRADARPGPAVRALQRTLRTHKLETVCEQARCPNLNRCFASGTATFMILGAVCTRTCRFCNVTTGRPGAVDRDEPERIARAVAEFGLRHAVITSVNRDDLPDGGAGHFVATIDAIRRRLPSVSVEVLTPDFQGECDAIDAVADAQPDVFNHNVETVPRLYRDVRPGARYTRSLSLLRGVKRRHPELVTKSGLMLGLGEERAEVLEVLRDLRSSGVDAVTLGQYLRPTLRHLEVARYLEPEEFDALGADARDLGFRHVASGPLVRSSFHADDAFEVLSAAGRSHVAL
jgi:lipoic acid synthetase